RSRNCRGGVRSVREQLHICFGTTTRTAARTPQGVRRLHHRRSRGKDSDGKLVTTNLNLSTLFETLAQELERPRELSPRGINYGSGTYSIDKDAVGTFLSNELPKLEEYEIDLVLSPLFTPKLADQAI